MYICVEYARVIDDESGEEQDAYASKEKTATEAEDDQSHHPEDKHQQTHWQEETHEAKVNVGHLHEDCQPDENKKSDGCSHGHVLTQSVSGVHGANGCSHRAHHECKGSQQPKIPCPVLISGCLSVLLLQTFSKTCAHMYTNRHCQTCQTHCAPSMGNGLGLAI